MESNFYVANRGSNESIAQAEQWLRRPGSAISMWSISAVFVGLAGYIALCSLLRFRRLESLQSKFNYTDRASLSRMTNQDAFEIVYNMAHWEFPLMYDVALRLALFQVR